MGEEKRGGVGDECSTCEEGNFAEDLGIGGWGGGVGDGGMVFGGREE